MALNTMNEIYLDVNQKNIQTMVLAHQYDKKSRYILCHIINDGEPVDLSAVNLLFKVYTQDNRAILYDITDKQQETGDVVIELSESLLCSGGRHQAEVIMYDQTIQLTTMNFTLFVEESVFSDDRAIASDEFSALTDALTKVQHAVEVGEELEVLNERVTEDEAVRVTAETARASAEEDRQDAEDVRITNEQTRVQNETTRVSAETARVSAETDRLSAEENRQDAEDIRVANEAERVSNETARVSAEAERISAETGRVTAEGLRVTAETERETNTSAALENMETAIDAAETATAAAEAETEIQIANNTHAEELIAQMEDIVDENQYLVKSMLEIPSTQLVKGIPTLDENAKLKEQFFPYELSTTQDIVDYIEDYFGNL